MALLHLDSVDAALAWLARQGVSRLATDSRRVTPGDAFIAWPGYAVDGRRFVPHALAAGARACLIEADGAEAFGLAIDGARAESVATLGGLKAATGLLASRFMGTPGNQLEVIACTGTNGKTSMAWWTAQALTALGKRCAVIGTLGIGEPPSRHQEASLTVTGMTTPDPVTLHAAYRHFVDVGIQACAVEASSIGLAEHRLTRSKVDVALFSNFTQDHLDFHGTMAAYWQAKSALFAWPGLRSAVINVDDEHGRMLFRTLEGGAVRDLWTYSAVPSCAARLQATGIRYERRGLHFEVIEGASVASVSTGLIGDYNVSNLLAVIGGLRSLGFPLAAAADVCGELTPVPGRMQRVPSEIVGPEVVVDYAHTPDALEKVLTALQPFATERGGRLWCVFGCGGNRDTGKRPLMGAVAARLAQHVVVTSDNPRLEPPEAIIAQIMLGAASVADETESGDVVSIENRSSAISLAIETADARDVILLAGKGHEDYQDIAGVKHHFSDVERAELALRERTGSTK